MLKQFVFFVIFHHDVRRVVAQGERNHLYKNYLYQGGFSYEEIKFDNRDR